MAAAHALMQLPSASLFRFPPNPEPGVIPPPPPGSLAYSPPISISDHVYSAALDVRVPLTIAAVYAVTSKLLNVYNKSRGNRPWALSRTRAFSAFVVAHNVFLAVYSAWTWFGMLGTLRRSFASPFASTGGSRTGTWAATADSICRLSGAPGLGNGLHYDEAAGLWVTQSSPVLSSFAVIPDRSQPGRIWNEGLAFYGWIFYLSKFYEVLDTFIILAKGKQSSTLQTYHHAGVMMCMWAGMRYMSAPIWLFVFVNSGIHTLMYSYYTFTAFSVRVPSKVKRSLTLSQITQFLGGAAVAMSHSFIYYTVPVSAPSGKAAAPPFSASAGPSSVLRALQNLVSGTAAHASPSAQTLHPNSTSNQGPAATSFKTVPCIATTGETFAIWLNVLYLAPLTYLFVKFFITSYLRRSSAESARVARLGEKSEVDRSSATGPGSVGPAILAATIATTESVVRRRLSNVGSLAEKAGWDAARGLEKEVYGDSDKAVETDNLAPAASAPAPSGKAKKARGMASKHAK